MAEVAAGAAVAAATGTGMGLFGYNRANYMMDQKNHYSRFTAGLNSAIAQTGMYKQDIADMTSLTVTRQDVYHSIAAMGLTILTAIYCPGRVGLHTPPPPGWLMGLSFLNIAGCYMFLGLTLWLCIHAAFRADTAGTHMQTRFLRLPIPSQGLLDKARKFGSSWEEQPLREVFRIPFTKHTNAEGEAYNEDMSVDPDAKARARAGVDVPPWYRMEKKVDNTNTVETMQSLYPFDGEERDIPEHFQAYRQLQVEWFPYDVYSRVSIFLAFMHLLHCWAYLQIGHQLQETRALFACALVMLSMFMLMQIVLTLDIIPRGFPIHRLGPFGLWFAYFAAAIEYKRWYTPGAQQLGFIFVYIAHAIHIVYTLQLIRLCAPSQEPPEVAELPGASWWPKEWQLPAAFEHAIWLVAPPRELEAGQVDIVAELRAQQRDGPKVSTSSPAEKRKNIHGSLGEENESAAWWNVRTGLLAMLIGWIFLTFGFTIEVIYQGTNTPSLLNAPGMPNNARDPRYRPNKVGAHEPTEVGTGGIHHGPARGIHMESMHRRLSAAETEMENSPEIAARLRTLVPYLRELAQGGALSFQEEPVAVQAEPAAVQWPALFEPEMLACHAASPKVLALSRHGRGALIAAAEEQVDQLLLEGVTGHGPIAGATWEEAGLLLVTSSGTILECPSAGSAAGRWSCHPVSGPPVPVSNAVSGSVAVTRTRDGSFKAAVLFPGEKSVTIFSRRVESQWLPVGEVSVKFSEARAAFAQGGEALHLTAPNGEVHQLHLGTGVRTHAAPAGVAGHAWPAACQTQSGNFARLALAETAAAKLFMN